MTGAVLLTYRPLAERDTAARICSPLAARFGRQSLVFVPHLRPERFADFRAVVALVGQGENAQKLGPWLADLRAAVQGGVPVVLVVVDGAVRPSAQLWPDDPHGPVISISTADLDRDVEPLIVTLSPFMSGEARPDAARVSRSAAGSAARDLPDPDPSKAPSEEDLFAIPDAAAAKGLDEADLESLAHSRFAPPPALPDGLGRLAGANEEEDGGARARPLPQTPIPAFRPSPSLVRPVPSARMPGAAPFPPSIRPSEPEFASPPKAVSDFLNAQLRLGPDPIETSGSRLRVWLGSAFALALVLGAAALAYVFRSEIDGLFGP